MDQVVNEKEAQVAFRSNEEDCRKCMMDCMFGGIGSWLANIWKQENDGVWCAPSIWEHWICRKFVRKNKTKFQTWVESGLGFDRLWLYHPNLKPLSLNRKLFCLETSWIMRFEGRYGSCPSNGTISSLHLNLYVTRWNNHKHQQ